jgi:hypothetical protein
MRSQDSTDWDGAGAKGFHSAKADGAKELHERHDASPAVAAAVNKGSLNDGGSKPLFSPLHPAGLPLPARDHDEGENDERHKDLQKGITRKPMRSRSSQQVKCVPCVTPFFQRPKPSLQDCHASTDLGGSKDSQQVHWIAQVGDAGDSKGGARQIGHTRDHHRQNKSQGYRPIDPFGRS